MDNAREQVLGQFGSVTGPAKVLEVLQDGASFGHAVSAGRHLWKAIQVVIASCVSVRETLFSTTGRRHSAKYTRIRSASEFYGETILMV